MGGAEVSLEHLYKVFTMPEGKDSKLAQIEQHLSDNLSDFLSQHVVTKVNSLEQIEKVLLNLQCLNQLSLCPNMLKIY